MPDRAPAESLIFVFCGEKLLLHRALAAHVLLEKPFLGVHKANGKGAMKGFPHLLQKSGSVRGRAFAPAALMIFK